MSNDGKQFGLIECCVCSEPAIWIDENEDYFCDACKEDWPSVRLRSCFRFEFLLCDFIHRRILVRCSLADREVS